MRTKKSIQKKTEERISAMPVGEVFSLSDFSELCTQKTASTILDRICDGGGVKKIMRGIYWKPDGKGPDPSRVAEALARSNNWHIAPCGETALHIFGAGKRPKVWTYVTDGTYRDYNVSGDVISFRHTSGRLLAAMSEKTRLCVQVLKAIGHNTIPEKVRERFTLYSEAERELIIKESKNITAWISVTLKKLLSK